MQHTSFRANGRSNTCARPGPHPATSRQLRGSFETAQRQLRGSFKAASRQLQRQLRGLGGEGASEGSEAATAK
eukprot:13399367-Alexandrium_andersonii.AAC.1